MYLSNNSLFLLIQMTCYDDSVTELLSMTKYENVCSLFHFKSRLNNDLKKQSEAEINMCWTKLKGSHYFCSGLGLEVQSSQCITYRAPKVNWRGVTVVTARSKYVQRHHRNISILSQHQWSWLLIGHCWPGLLVFISWRGGHWNMWPLTGDHAASQLQEHGDQRGK